MSEPNKAVTCAMMANLPVRYFMVASNKKNMRQYRNVNAERRVGSRNWFYCFLMRILLERVTYFVRYKSLEQHGEIKKVKLEYSDKGGHSYPQMKAYYNWLKMRPLYLDKGEILWDVLHHDLQEIRKHKDRAGLQLADVVSGSFFKSCDIYDTGGCDPQFAKLLKPRMGKIRYANQSETEGIISGYGVKLLPNWATAKLRPEQEDIFKFYGYPEKEWWAPASSAKSG
jgi:hypothetical protein